jgi:transposase
MFIPPPQVRVFLRAGVTDMRKAFDGLFGIATEIIKVDPLSGHLFVFCNRRRDRLKILFADGTGLWVCSKRLESGTFSWPDAPTDGASVEMSAADLSMLLSGVEMSSVTRRRWRRFALAK